LCSIKYSISITIKTKGGFMNFNSGKDASRIKELIEVAEAYFDSLKKKSFDTIPYDDNVSLRAPLTPGGVDHPVTGKQALYNQWWVPLEPALQGVMIKVLGHYIHQELEGIISEAEITLAGPNVTLRVADRFTVNESGKITEQENHFDPRAVTGG
jgi:hypothetical protein